MKHARKWSKNRFFLAMLLAATLTLALYFLFAYQNTQNELNTLKTAPEAPEY